MSIAKSIRLKIGTRKERDKKKKNSRKNLHKPPEINTTVQAALQRPFKTTACRLALVAHQRIDLFVCRCRHGGPLPSLYFPFLTNLSLGSSSWTTTSSSSSSVSSLTVMDAACRRSRLSLKPHSQSALCHGHRRQTRAPRQRRHRVKKKNNKKVGNCHGNR